MFKRSISIGILFFSSFVFANISVESFQGNYVCTAKLHSANYDHYVQKLVILSNAAKTEYFLSFGSASVRNGQPDPDFSIIHLSEPIKIEVNTANSCAAQKPVSMPPYIKYPDCRAVSLDAAGLTYVWRARNRGGFTQFTMSNDLKYLTGTHKDGGSGGIPGVNSFSCVRK